jgi:transcriptional regulator with XRE-family HTH domain
MADTRAPLWRNPNGKTVERIFGALVLDELCRRADLTTAELLRRLRSRLQRPMSRQTLAAWRRGEQSIPTEVLFAVAYIVGITIGDAASMMAMLVLEDKAADPEFTAAVRRYYTRDRLKALRR